MVKRLVAKYGSMGADTDKVLKDECPKKSLQHRMIDKNETIKVLRCSRPVIFAFWLTNDQWEQFSDFFRDHPKGTLGNSDITRSSGKLQGHAVILTSQSA